MKHPYEIHLTARNDTNIDLFLMVCKKLNVKSIVLKNLTRNGDEILDLLTSTIKYEEHLNNVLEFMTHLSTQFYNNGIEIVRKKVETYPTHPAIIHYDNFNSLLPFQYFEIHIKVKNDYYLDLILERQSQTVYQSFKDQETRFLTLRSHSGCIEHFEERCQDFWQYLLDNSVTIVSKKLEIEFAIFDSNVNHDSQWIKGN